MRHFLLLVKCLFVELMEVLFQPEPHVYYSSVLLKSKRLLFKT
jgi:hypothetical protein